MEATKPLSRKLQVLFLSLGRFFTTLAGLISVIFLSRLLSMDEYANYRQTLLVYGFLTPFLSLGFDKGIYYNFEKKKDNHGEQLINIQYVLLSIALLFSLFFTFGGAGLISQLFNNSNIEKGIIIYSVFSIFNLPILLLQPILVINNKVKLLTIFNFGNKLFSVIITIIVAYFYKDANSVLISILFVGIITFIIVEIILIKNIKSINSFKRDTKILKEYSKIGLPLLLASVMGIAGKNIDKLLISTLMTPADFAIYANGAIEIPLIGAITGAIMVVILADFTKMLNVGKVKEVFQLWGKAVETTSSILIPIMFILLLNADWLIIAMFGEKYAESALPFKIYLSLLPMRTMIFSSLIIASGKTKLISKGAFIFLISNIVISIIFIKIFGFIGPAIATVISTYILGIFYSFYIAKINKISFFEVFSIKSIIYYFITGLISLIISTWITKFVEINFIYKIIILNIIFVTIFVLCIILFRKKNSYYELISILKK